MLQKAKYIGIGCAVLVVIIVVLQNTETVQTQILFFTIEMPRAAMLFGAMLIGFAIGVIAAGRIVIGRRSETDEPTAEPEETPES